MAFEFAYENIDRLHADDFAEGFSRWHHEGIGELVTGPGGGMRMHCQGSRMGSRACMAFFKPTLPDNVAVEYDIIVHSHGGLIINYIALRGIDGEDALEDSTRLRPRTGIMANYYSRHWGLQSYHVSISRFGADGIHTGTCNFRRNPGALLMAHGVDLVREIGKVYHIRLTKFAGHCALFVDGACTLGFVDRDVSRLPIPDSGKFGFRLIGSDVKADVSNFRVYSLKDNPGVFKDGSQYVPEDVK